MEKKPLVTLYITNHNYGRYIEQAIQSVLDQEFQDFELIIIDDGSTDDSLDKIIKYESRKDIHIVRQKNQGLTVSNNIALKLGSGKYIMRLDADDYLDPRALEIMVSALEKNENLALVFPDYYEVDENGEIIGQVRRHDFDKDVSLFDQPAHGACTMIRRNILLEVGGYDETFNRQDGYDLWLNIVTDYTVKNINLPLFYYRQHFLSLTREEKLLLETRSKIIEKHVKKRGEKELAVLAVIPVRGSVMDRRSLPLEKLGDNLLIDWTIGAALRSTKLSHILLSTHDANVLHHAKRTYGNKILYHEREMQYARINEGLNATLKDALNFYTQVNPEPDAMIVLNIESPFRSEMYINKAIHVMQLYNVDVVVGVRMDDDIFYIHDGKGLKPNNSENGLRLERDSLYRKVGGLTLIDRKFFSKKNKIIGGKIGHIILDQKSAFSIKSELDWQIAEALV